MIYLEYYQIKFLITKNLFVFNNKNAGRSGLLLPVVEVRPSTNSSLISGDCALNSCLIII